MKVKDIIQVIEDFAPLSIQEGWDNSGLCVGSPEDEATSVLIGLDCTEKLVDEAIECSQVQSVPMSLRPQVSQRTGRCCPNPPEWRGERSPR